MELLLLFWICLIGLTAPSESVRLCVTDQSSADCSAMASETRGSSAGLECVTAADRYMCLEKLRKDEADVMRAGPEDVFLARELYNSLVSVVAETRSAEEMKEPYRYQGVAVVRKSRITKVSDLKGSKSCHTGYGRTAGWNIPFANLLELGQIQLQCEQKATVVEHDLRGAASYFGLACIPGKWVPDEDTDAKLKSKYNKLCTMCGGTCDDEDNHAGYEGSLRCLVDSHGDVAWTKLSAARKFFKMRPDFVNTSDFGLLCTDDTIVELDDPKPCHWAARPWNAWLGRAEDEKRDAIVTALTKVLDSAMPTAGVDTDFRPWSGKVLGIDSPSIIHAIPQPMTPRAFLSEPGYDKTIDRLGCPDEPVKLCVETRIGGDKCFALQQVLKSRRIRPTLECISPSSGNCLDMVAQGEAHITSADGGDVYKGHIEYGIMPVVTERYGLLDASYFAVAVVRADSGINSFHELKGKKSCHTGIGRTAGWKIPVVTLLEAGLIQPGNCDYAGEVGSFFSSSCAPGAKDPHYDSAGTNPDSLCDLCVGREVGGASGPTYAGGDAEGKCKRSGEETFFGYSGAFRCLVQGGGDVAFVKHSTVADNTNGNSNASWTQGLRALDFKLLCKVTGTADIVDYNTCNLARVPAHKFITGIKSDNTMLEEIRILLLRASDNFPKGQDVFTMFGPFRGHHDVIFKDSATALVNVREDVFHKSLDDVYYRALTELSECTPKESSPRGSSERGPDDGANNASVLQTLTTLLSLMIFSVMVWR